MEFEGCLEEWFTAKTFGQHIIASLCCMYIVRFEMTNLLLPLCLAGIDDFGDVCIFIFKKNISQMFWMNICETWWGCLFIFVLSQCKIYTQFYTFQR